MDEKTPRERIPDEVATDETAVERGLRRLDARTLRGLAHPLRMEMLSALRRGGPATASQLAARLGESSGATSYHLRQLAAYGFVADAPDRGKGRERWWQAVDEGIDFGHELMFDADPETKGAVDVFLHELANTHARELSTWVATREEWQAEWAGATDMSDFTLRLTPELSRELSRRMHELVGSYQGLADEDTTVDGAPTARFRIHLHAFPQRES
ncbi:ArsR/SmtB family transcription factor [Streptomyces sp. JNUCC 64]